MARYTTNLLFKGASGRIGGVFVLRQYKGQTILAKYPEKSRKAPTIHQVRQRERFKKAVAYARSVLYSEELYTIYKKKNRKGKSIFQYVVAEQMKILREEETRPEEEEHMQLLSKSSSSGKAVKLKRKRKKKS